MRKYSTWKFYKKNLVYVVSIPISSATSLPVKVTKTAVNDLILACIDTIGRVFLAEVIVFRTDKFLPLKVFAIRSLTFVFIRVIINLFVISFVFTYTSYFCFTS